MGNCAGYCNGQGEEDGQIGRDSLKNKGALIKPDSDDYDLEKKYGKCRISKCRPSVQHILTLTFSDHVQEATKATIRKEVASSQTRAKLMTSRKLLTSKPMHKVASTKARLRFVTVRLTLDSGWIACVMARARSFGLMAAATKANGVMIRPTGRASLCTRTATSTRASGSTIRPRAEAPTHMPMARTTRETGSMINSTGREPSLGQTAHSMMESMRMERRKARGG